MKSRSLRSQQHALRESVSAVTASRADQQELVSCMLCPDRHKREGPRHERVRAAITRTVQKGTVRRDSRPSSAGPSRQPAGPIVTVNGCSNNMGRYHY
eukprot:363045-Chlamydomonas_euryale.AAC.9